MTSRRHFLPSHFFANSKNCSRVAVRISLINLQVRAVYSELHKTSSSQSNTKPIIKLFEIKVFLRVCKFPATWFPLSNWKKWKPFLNFLNKSGSLIWESSTCIWCKWDINLMHKYLNIKLYFLLYRFNVETNQYDNENLFQLPRNTSRKTKVEKAY